MLTESAPTKKLKVLFLCTGNSARSILAEILPSPPRSSALRSFQRGREPQGPRQPARARGAARRLPHRRERRAQQVLGGISRREIRLRHYRLRQGAGELSGLARAADHRALGIRRSRCDRCRRRGEAPSGEERRGRNLSSAWTLHGASDCFPGPPPARGGDAEHWKSLRAIRPRPPGARGRGGRGPHGRRRRPAEPGRSDPGKALPRIS